MSTLESKLILSMVNRVTAPARAVQADMRRVRDTAGRMGTSIARTARGFTLALTAAAGGVLALANSTAKQGDRIAKQARVLGISAEKLQELEFAAERAGIGSQQLTSNMTALTKRLGEGVQKGTGPAVDAMEALGLNIEEVAKLPADQQLGLIADRMKDIDSATERAAIASQLYGRAGVNMTEMLAGGSQGLVDRAQEARALGLIIPEEATRRAEEFQDSMTNAGSALTGVKNTFGTELMPVISDFMKQFTAFVTENPKQIKQMADDFAAGVKRMLEGLPEFLRKLQELLNTVRDITVKVKEMVGGWDNLLAVVGALLARKMLTDIARFAFSVGSLAFSATTLAAAKLGAFVSFLKSMAGVAGIGALATSMTAIAGAVKTLAGFSVRRLVPGLGFVAPDQIANGELTDEASEFNPTQGNIDKMSRGGADDNDSPSPRSLQDLQEHAKSLRGEIAGVQERIDDINQDAPGADTVLRPLLENARRLREEMEAVERAMDRMRNRSGSGASSGGIEARAGGGPVQRGRPYLVGERGRGAFHAATVGRHQHSPSDSRNGRPRGSGCARTRCTGGPVAIPCKWQCTDISTASGSARAI